MKIKLVRESVNFERGGDPKTVMGIGIKMEITDEMINFTEDVLDQDVDEWGAMYDEFKDSIGFGNYEFIGHDGMMDDYPAFEKVAKVIKRIKSIGDIIDQGEKPWKASQEWHRDIDKISYKLYPGGLLEIGDGSYFLRSDLI